MKRLLALALCTSMLASPALAQYYGGPGPGGGYGGGGGGGYGRGYSDDDEPAPRRRPRWEERREDRRGEYGGDGYGQQRGRGGSICITSRGSCASRPLPRNAPCRCDLPGVGEKRGNIQ